MKMRHPLPGGTTTAEPPEMPVGERLLAYRSPSGSSARRRRVPRASTVSKVPRLLSFGDYAELDKRVAAPVVFQRVWGTPSNSCRHSSLDFDNTNGRCKS